MKRHFKYDNGKKVRCGHRWCSDCRTRRGRNYGNRIFRRKARKIIADQLKED